jgi:ParB family chromosome partitioning protein
MIGVNELELHQLDRRYEGLRRREPRREARLLASLSEHGQQIPIVVVGEHVVVDGFKRLRALAKLAHDTVAVIAWSIEERDALLLGRVMRTAEEDALEQGWLLCELRDRFSMSPSEMAQRFDKSESWVSRRLALVVDLPREVQEHVRAGALGAYAAMKYFVPLARANQDVCVALAAELSRHKMSTRQIGAVYAAWMAGDEAERAALIADPLLFLRAMAAAKAPESPPQSASELLIGELGMICGVAHRAQRRARDGAARELLPSGQTEMQRMLNAAKGSCEQLFVRCEKELELARRGDSLGHPSSA